MVEEVGLIGLIVLEESTDNIYIVDQRHAAAAAPLITAGIQINSSAALMVTGSPSLSNLASTDATAADNRYYEFNFSSASCSKPYGFLSSNITTNSVDLSWIRFCKCSFLQYRIWNFWIFARKWNIF